MLLQLEQECLDVYRRKVEQASLSRAHLHQAIADVETEIAHLTSALGDRPLGKVRYGTLTSLANLS
jgi:protein regulator of cytokinesis 1